MRAAIVSLLVLALAVACGKPPRIHYYVLDPERDAAASTTGEMRIGVRAFRVDPPYDQDRIVYRVGEESTEIGFYRQHRWAAPLSRMLPRIVAQALADPGAGPTIEPAAPDRRYDAYLSGRLVSLEEVDTPAGPTVRVRLELRLSAADGTELWAETLSGAAATRADDVGGIVRAMRNVLTETLRKARPAISSCCPRG